MYKKHTSTRQLATRLHVLQIDGRGVKGRRMLYRPGAIGVRNCRYRSIDQALEVRDPLLSHSWTFDSRDTNRCLDVRLDLRPNMLNGVEHWTVRAQTEEGGWRPLEQGCQRRMTGCVVTHHNQILQRVASLHPDVEHLFHPLLC